MKNNKSQSKYMSGNKTSSTTNMDSNLINMSSNMPSRSSILDYYIHSQPSIGLSTRQESNQLIPSFFQSKGYFANYSGFGNGY